MPGAMFFLVGAFIAVSNAWSALRFVRQRERHQPGEAPSVIPLAGDLLMVAGMLTAPLAALHMFAWVPLFLDYGCLPTIGRALAVAMFGRHQPEQLTAVGGSSMLNWLARTIAPNSSSGSWVLTATRALARQKSGRTWLAAA